MDVAGSLLVAFGVPVGLFGLVMKLGLHTTLAQMFVPPRKTPFTDRRRAAVSSSMAMVMGTALCVAGAVLLAAT